MRPILEVKNLSTHFTTRNGVIRAVDGVDITVNEGDTLGVVGESGCGKTVLALSIIRLVPPRGRIVSGSIVFDGLDLLRLKEDEMQRVRGKDISMIFQEPMTSLNPVFRVGEQIAEVMRRHQGLSGKDALERAVGMLRLVGIPSPERRIGDYPHQMSGGMRQRVMIAIALACNPRLMLADEPTTALDVTIQAQIIDLINALKEQVGASVVMITHDLGVIAEMARFVAVMYAGKVVEYSPVEDIFSTPLHPYTIGLLESIPKMDGIAERESHLKVIPGNVPGLHNRPPGCRFFDRCFQVMTVCRQEEPELAEKAPGHTVRCWKYI
ncbi:MAG: ABC transporter ATP-binding protein [Syntrophales bacterium]|nr:ABC transporter ATP-binding protein [Syntrophales bacterium]